MPTVWYCLTRSNKQRVATTSVAQVEIWQRTGCALEFITQDKASAHKWVMKPVEQTEPAWQNMQGPSPVATAHGDDKLKTVTPPAREMDKSPVVALLERTSKLTARPDPSVGTEKIYDTDPADEKTMDDLLLPPDLTERESKQEFFELAMDVTSLPGGYRTTDDDDFGNADVLMKAFGRSRYGQYRNWRRPTHNALAKITSREELFSTVRDVETTVKHHRQAQGERIRKFMYGCHHEADYIDLYLQVGMLPKLVEQTYTFYLGLLNFLRSTVYEATQDQWRDSYAHRVIKHHALELGQIRSTASDYRSHLLRTYVYLRNAHKEKYQDSSFTRSLFFSTMVKEGKAKEEGTGASDANRCRHCRRVGTHAGTEKADCPLKFMTPTAAQKAVASLNKSQAKKVMKSVAEAVKNDPNCDVAATVATARSEV